VCVDVLLPKLGVTSESEKYVAVCWRVKVNRNYSGVKFVIPGENFPSLM